MKFLSVSFFLLSSVAFGQPAQRPVLARARSVSSVHNDCGFRALGLLRRDAIQRLIHLIEAGNAEVIRMVGAEFIVETTDPEPLEGVPRTFTAQDLQEYLQDRYLDGEEMLYYHPEGVGTMVALAYAYQIELRIFMDQSDGSARRILHYRPPIHVSHTVNLLHTTADVRVPRARNHFEILEFPEMALTSSPPDRVSLERLPQNSLLRQLHCASQPCLTVVFDLDETLVSNRDPCSLNATLRPHVFELLKGLIYLSGVEIILWTASNEETASPVVTQLHERGRVFDEIIYRNNLWFNQSAYTKDLTLLNRNMDRVIMFDNTPDCCRLHLNNSVLVKDFDRSLDPLDETLKYVYEIVYEIYKGVWQSHQAVSNILLTLLALETYLEQINGFFRVRKKLL